MKVRECLLQSGAKFLVCYQKCKKNWVCRNIILPILCIGVKSGHPHFGDERRVRMCENRVVRGIFGPKSGEVTGEWRALMVCTLHRILLG
jgi:hypothetical protein